MSPRIPFFLARLSVLASAGAMAVAVTGGLVLSPAGVRLTITDPVRLLVLALAAMLASAVLATRETAATWWKHADRAAPWLAAAAAAGALGTGIRAGTFVAGGADSYGYVSQAVLWAEGRTKVEQPIGTTVPWPDGDATFMPLGYRPGVQRGTLVPTYPPGLPLTMAGPLRLFGRDGVFYVVPALGALAVWLTFVLGRRLGGPTTGAVAAVLLASSPIFIYQVVQPMSDVPAAAWWLAALAVAASGRRWAAAAGVLSSVAILTRPNLLPMAAVVAWVAGMGRRRARPPNPGTGTHDGRAHHAACDEGGAIVQGAHKGRPYHYPSVLAFGAGVVPGLAALGAIQRAWYGSPFASGYGDLRLLFAWANIPTNVSHYAQWLLATETPLILLGLGAPLLRRHQAPAATRSLAWACLTGAAVVAGCYLPYQPFDAWWFLRFLLPAIPLLVALAAAVAVTRLSRLPGTAGPVALVLLVSAFVVFGLRASRERGAFDLRALEGRYVEDASWVAAHTPENAVVLAFQQSGSLRYYTGRLTLRWDLLDPRWLDTAFHLLRERSREPYILLQPAEERPFREHFAGAPVLSLLARPLATLPSGTRVFRPE